jgi:hypothetical protein
MRIYLGWSGVSWARGMELYYSDQRVSGMEPDASRGIHHVEGVGVIRHFGSIGDVARLREPHGYQHHDDEVGDVVVLARRKMFLFDKLHVVVNGTEYRGHEVLDIHRRRHQ